MNLAAVTIIGFSVGIGAAMLWPESETEKAERIAKEEARAQYQAERKQKGFHCLSSYNGENFHLKHRIKNSLRDPDSYQHVETRITPLNEKTGMHTLVTQYRARNGFGGYTMGMVYAELNNECDILKVKVLS